MVVEASGVRKRQRLEETKEALGRHTDLAIKGNYAVRAVLRDILVHVVI